MEIPLATQSQLSYLPLVVSQKPIHAATTGKSLPWGAACPLSKVKAGTPVRIKQLLAAPEVCQRLREMGFCEEQHIRLLLQHQNVVCQVCNVRLGLSAELADTIVVEPLTPHQHPV